MGGAAALALAAAALAPASNTNAALSSAAAAATAALAAAALSSGLANNDIQLQQPGTHRDLQLPEHWLLPPRGQESRLVDGWRGWQRVAVRIRICL